MNNTHSEIPEVLDFLGFTKVSGSSSLYQLNMYADQRITACAQICDRRIVMNFKQNGKPIISAWQPRSTSNPGAVIAGVDKVLKKLGCDLMSRQTVFAAVNTKQLTADIVRCRSSNVWGYKFNVKSPKDKFGDLIMQFKGTQGGPGDLYIYYSVPIQVYRRMQSAPSVGHYFWVYVRNNYKYSKLTGNKHGVLPNAINH